MLQAYNEPCLLSSSSHKDFTALFFLPIYLPVCSFACYRGGDSYLRKKERFEYVRWNNLKDGLATVGKKERDGWMDGWMICGYELV